MALLRTLLILILVYYLFRLLARWFAPKLFSYASRKAETHFREQFEGYQAAPRHEEGEVTIEKKTTSKNKGTDKIGEYIEFEEID